MHDPFSVLDRHRLPLAAGLSMGKRSGLRRARSADNCLVPHGSMPNSSICSHAFIAPIPCVTHHACLPFLRPASQSLCQRKAIRHVQLRVPRRSRFIVRAVQASPVSGDSDGDIETTTTQKSYSVGVTIVSGCDSRLRRNIIEKIAAGSSAGRVVVVTQGGITSTDEQDGPVVGAPEENLNGRTSESNGSFNGVSAVDANRPKDNLEGWISCSSPEEMAEVVAKLAAGRDCDYIVAEGSTDNSIEPQELASLLHARGGASLRVDSLVSVLDGDTLLTDLSALPSLPEADEAESSEDVGGQQPAMRDAADARPMMVVSLVENANVIIVSRSGDVAPSEGLDEVQSLLSVLNGTANILPATDEVVPVDQLLDTNLYSHESIRLGATWKKVLIASRNIAKEGAPKLALPKSVKDATFVYRARRPFHPQRLYEHIKAVATFNGVIRSTGRIWLATRMLAPLEWNQAGVAATLRLGKLFWAAVPETDWPADEEERKRITDNWDNQYGDRETEMVFVGMGIDKERLQGLLDGCLLQDEEMVFTNMWENFGDPFVEWVPLIEEDEEEDLVLDEGTTRVTDVMNSGIATDVEESDDEMEEVVSVKKMDVPGENAGNESGNEGEVDTEEIPGELYDRISALDIFEQGFSGTSESVPRPQSSQDGEYDEDDVVVSSWDGGVADGILQQMPKGGLPVTIVTGFLGSGKTTLLNYILTADHGLKIAVLVNEFGEIDIDNQLVEKGDWNSNDEVMELANGCICCSINDSFVNAVTKILERGDKVDYLIVETTGVADPVPVINSLMVSDVAEQVRVDGILTVVDAENFDPKTNMNSEAALCQIMAADTILLSKTDVAPTKKVEEVVEYIKSVRPAARILRSQRGRVPINMILDVGLRVADSPAHLNPVRTSAVDDAEHSHEQEHDHNPEAHSHDHNHEHGHKHDHECGPDCSDESHGHNHSNHLEADGFVTTSFKSDVALDAELFMNKFLYSLPQGVFRAKGLLHFYGYGGRYIFQLSGRRYQFDEDEWPEGVAPGNQLVVIGRNLDIESLRAVLMGCLVSEVM